MGVVWILSGTTPKIYSMYYVYFAHYGQCVPWLINILNVCSKANNMGIVWILPRHFVLPSCIFPNLLFATPNTSWCRCTCDCRQAWFYGVVQCAIITWTAIALPCEQSPLIFLEKLEDWRRLCLQDMQATILVSRGHDHFGQHQGWRPLAGPDFLSMPRVLILYFQPIRFSRIDNESVNHRLPVLEPARGLDA